MSALDNQPTNLNPAVATKFRIQFGRLPGVQYWCKDVTIPDVILGEVFQETSLSVLKQPGDKITFSPLIFGFIVDENLINYNEMLEWIKGVGFPDSHSQAGNYTPAPIRDAINTERSDASVFVLSSANNPIIEIKFRGLVPVSLGALNFDSSSDSAPLVADCTFNFEGSFDVVQLVS